MSKIIGIDLGTTNSAVSIIGIGYEYSAESKPWLIHKKP
jgi:molecular chaperone DnaK (HSP70)